MRRAVVQVHGAGPGRSDYHCRSHVTGRLWRPEASGQPRHDPRAPCLRSALLRVLRRTGSRVRCRCSAQLGLLVRTRLRGETTCVWHPATERACGPRRKLQRPENTESCRGGLDRFHLHPSGETSPTDLRLQIEIANTARRHGRDSPPTRDGGTRAQGRIRSPRYRFAVLVVGAAVWYLSWFEAFPAVEVPNRYRIRAWQVTCLRSCPRVWVVPQKLANPNRPTARVRNTIRPCWISDRQGPGCCRGRDNTQQWSTMRSYLYPTHR